MSDPPPIIGSNPSLTQSPSQNPGTTAAGSSHRLPGAFVPPSDSLARGVPKGASGATSRKNAPTSAGSLFALIGLGVIVFGGGAAALLFSGNDDVSVANEPQAQGTDLVAAPAASMGTAPLPDWVPTYPSGSQTMLASNVMEGKPTGTIQYKTTNSHQAVIEYYRQKLQEKKFVLTSSTIMMNTGVLEAKSEDGGRKIIVMSEPSPEGSNISVVFTALDPDKSRPLPGGSLPPFAEFYPGAQVLEHTSRIENGAVAGHFKLKKKIEDEAELQTEIKAIADFYEAKMIAAHYTIVRKDEPEFTTIEATSRKDAGPVLLFVVKEENNIIVTLKLGAKE